MPAPSQSHAYTTDFHQEFAADTLKLLRRRFLWFVGIVGAIYALVVLIYAIGLGALAFGVSREMAERELVSIRGGYWGMISVLVLIGVDVGVFVWCARQATLRRNDRTKLLGLTFQFFIYRGVADFLLIYLMRNEGFAWSLCLYHVIACGLLPWTPAQALRPLFFLLPLQAAMLVISHKAGWTRDLVWIFLTIVFLLPGLLIAWLKTTRRMGEFKMRFLQNRYGQMRRELVDARRIHEALFPKPIADGPLCFAYSYEPMRQIGGDYLYARFSPPPIETGEGEPALNILLIDVTGHGIAAALTVNRLYGEVERLFAEDPYASPADVLGALNRYVHLTLSRHSIYATALCMRVDIEKDRLEYASGGHPPAFLCAADGNIHELSSTSFVLGAVGPGDYDPGMVEVRLMPGDSVIAYTDGAIEARNPEGRMLGVLGLQKALASCLCGRAELAAQLLMVVEQHRSGPPEDDTLVVEISRRVGGLVVEERPTHGRSSGLPERRDLGARVDVGEAVPTIRP